MKLKLLGLALTLLFALPLLGQQTVTVTGNTSYNGTTSYSGIAPYTTQLTINGLPAGCVASISGTVITITGCTVPPPPVTVTTTCPASVQVGKTVQCSATVVNATNTAVTWTSTNTTVATVNATGLVTGVGVGTTSITAVSQADTTKSNSVSLQGVQAATLVTQDVTNPLPISSGSVLVQPTSDPPIAGVGTNKLTTTTVGQTYDYSVTVPVAGAYTLSLRLCTDATSTGSSLTAHFEMPAGTHVSTPLSLAGGTQWTTLSSTQSFNLPAGKSTLRLVIDSLASGPQSTSNAGYLHWFQLTPATLVASHLVTLTWTTGIATNPGSPECQNPQCPLPAGATPCYGAADSYNLYKSSTSGSYPATPLSSISAPSTTLIDTVPSGQTVYYTVKAYKSTGCPPESAASNEVKVVSPTP